MKAALTMMMCVALMGCATHKSEVISTPQHEQQSSAAVGRTSLFAFIGKAILQMVRNTKLNVTVESGKEKN